MNNTNTKIKQVLNSYIKIKIFVKREESTKIHLILPLFKALGWNINDPREVDYEKHRTDAWFALDGKNQFVLEMKKINKTISEEDEQQVIDYAFNNRFNYAVITNFKEIIIMDPYLEGTNVDNKIILKINYDEYLNRIGDLAMLSKEGMKKNLLNQFEERTGRKRKISYVDQELLSSLMIWREQLIKELKIKINNKEIREDYAQTILNRIIFIRHVEDTNGPFDYGSLAKISEKGNIIEKISKEFKLLDRIYDSDLFSQHSCDSKIKDLKCLKYIVLGTYTSKNGNNYRFDQIPIDTIGSLYEQYIGRIQYNKNSKTKQKVDGTYYTPTFITKKILENTLGEYIKSHTYNEIKKIKILDPACGSGSFLIEAYKYLCNYYKKQNKKLTWEIKKHILENNLFGIDIDRKAIQICRLNLMLNAYESNKKFKKFINLKVGNSIISDPRISKDKYFDWENNFYGINDKDHFDIIIGNPPYIFARNKGFSKDEKKYFYKNYELAKYQLNTYLLFIENSFKHLKSKGHLGFIVPNTWLTINSFKELRKFLLINTRNLEIINIYDKVFPDANVDSCLLIFEKDFPNKIRLGEIKNSKYSLIGKFKSDIFQEKNDFIINFSLLKDKKKQKIMEKINKKTIQLCKLATVKSGLKAYEVGKGNPAQSEKMKNVRIYHARKRKDIYYAKYLNGEDVQRYLINWSKEWLKYGENLAAPRNKTLFTSPRILVRQIPSEPPYSINSVYTDKYLLNDINSMVIYNFKKINPYFILGILNSKLTTFWFINTFDKLQRGLFPQFKVNELERFPLPMANRKQQTEVAEKAKKLIELYKKLEENVPLDTYERTKAEILRSNREIDELTYSLFNLNKTEIKFIENQKK